MKIREEKTLQAIVDLLPIINKNNIVKYNQLKKSQYEEIIEVNKNNKYISEQAKDLVKKYAENLEELENGDLRLDQVKDFLLDLKADHEEVWRVCENNALPYAGTVANIIVGDPQTVPAGEKF